MGEIKHATQAEMMAGRMDAITGYSVMHWNDMPDSCQKCEYGTNDYGVMGCSHPSHPTYSGCDPFGLCPDYLENQRVKEYYAEHDK